METRADCRSSARRRRSTSGRSTGSSRTSSANRTCCARRVGRGRPCDAAKRAACAFPCPTARLRPGADIGLLLRPERPRRMAAGADGALCPDGSSKWSTWARRSSTASPMPTARSWIVRWPFRADETAARSGRRASASAGTRARPALDPVVVSATPSAAPAARRSWWRRHHADVPSLLAAAPAVLFLGLLYFLPMVLLLLQSVEGGSLAHYREGAHRRPVCARPGRHAADRRLRERRRAWCSAIRSRYLLSPRLRRLAHRRHDLRACCRSGPACSCARTAGWSSSAATASSTAPCCRRA